MLREDFKVSKLDTPRTLGEKLVYGLSDRTAEPAVMLSLIKAGADRNQTDEGMRTSLMWAVTWDHRQAYDALFAKPGVKVDAQDETGWTALMRAVWCRRKDYVEDLLENRNANPEIVAHDGQHSALSIAKMFGDKDIAEMIEKALQRRRTEHGKPRPVSRMK
jgi:ankyrin repeat protein